MYTRLKDSSGWQQVFTSPHIDNCIERIAINAKINSQNGNSDGSSVMVAISYGNQVRLWGVSELGSRTNIGNSCLYKKCKILDFMKNNFRYF